MKKLKLHKHNTYRDYLTYYLSLNTSQQYYLNLLKDHKQDLEDLYNIKQNKVQKQLDYTLTQSKSIKKETIKKL